MQFLENIPERKGKGKNKGKGKKRKEKEKGKKKKKKKMSFLGKRLPPTPKHTQTHLNKHNTYTHTGFGHHLAFGSSLNSCIAEKSIYFLNKAIGISAWRSPSWTGGVERGRGEGMGGEMRNDFYM